ncbi:MAG: hypothetical protein EBU84_01765 [Actinobacteria bacterium]|nr:hypothetical protein [Actinomycetota bacterium]
MAAATRRAGTKPKTKVLSARAQDVLSSTVSADEATLSGMARLIAGMNVNIPVVSQLPTPEERIKQEPIPTLTRVEVVMMSTMARPEEWHLVLTGPKRRTDLGFRELGTCFEMVTRKSPDGVNHYVRYTASGTLSAAGQAAQIKLHEKLRRIQDAVVAGKANRIGRPRTRTTERSQPSLSHASKYPLNDIEKKFLSLINTPNVRVCVDENTTAHSAWHTFRWKWTRHYGFDLSQISIGQEKQPNGAYNVYAQYTPNKLGQMNPKLAELVEFLKTKPVR